MNYTQAFQEITDYFKDRHEAPKALIVGKERTGKTELLLMLKKYYKEQGYNVAFLDGQLMYEHAESGLIFLAKELNIEIPNEILKIDYLISPFVESAIKEKQYSKDNALVILLDEYLCVKRSFLAFLRAICINPDIGVIVVECSEHKAIEEDDGFSSPLENILYPTIHLDKKPIR